MANLSDQTSNSKHLSFHCSSGELVWGQLHCICEGYFNGQHNRYDTPQSVPEFGEGGTIKQRNYHYRCRAVKGDWQTKFYQTRWDLESEPFKSGYVIYHSDHNPAEILRRCVAVGFSLDQKHNDRSIVYINRYDWSHHHDYDFEYKINKLLEIKKNKSNSHFCWESSFHGRILVIDSNSAMNIIQQWKSNRTEFSQFQENVFIDTCNESNNRVGLHLSFPNPDYDLAWLVFNSDQSDAELIGIVYDGSYTSLDGQVILDGKDIVSWNEYQSKIQELHRHNEELLKKWQSAAKDQKPIS